MNISPLRFRPAIGLLVRRAAVAAFVLASGMPAARSQDAPRLHTNQSYVEEVTRATALAIDDPAAVFAFVFNALPDRVKVYPTENYYYFSFVHGGIPYDGNIRLDASDRDAGKLHFGYSEDLADWREETPVNYVVLDETKGVRVEKLERFLYRVTYGAKSVTFALNDLSEVKPPPAILGEDERFVGPVFDESGLRFFLVFNARLKIFHYLLDETAPVAEAFTASRRTDRIVIGKRTGYAFYRDAKRDRKILIGVYFGNSRVNNYFDGPFDQLPDNFIKGDEFRDLLLQVEPKLRGTIDRFGAPPGGAERYMIAPYFYYQTEADLYAFHRCATDRRIAPAAYYACFVADEKSQRVFKLLPLAWKRQSLNAAGARRKRR